MWPMPLPSQHIKLPLTENNEALPDFPLMLSGLLNLSRFRNGTAHPYHLQLNPKNLALATSLLELFGASLNRKRYELEEDIKALVLEKINPKVIQGLAKILFNRCEFSNYGVPDPQTLREQVFSASADYWKSLSGFSHQPELHKEQILKAIALPNESLSMETDAWLFGDIGSNQVLRSFDPLLPKQLIHRYNIEQVQGLLLNSENLELKVLVTKDRSFKQVMQMLKFFQLLYQVTGSGTDWLSLVIDGPGSILENSQSYGVEIANFFPAVLLLSVPWYLTATLKIPGRSQRFRLELSDQNPYQTFYQARGVWNHEKVAALITRFNEKYSGQMVATAENRLIPLSNNQFLLPDMMIERLSDKRSVLVEWVHYLTAAKLKQLALLKAELPAYYLIAVKGQKSKTDGLQKKLGQQLAVYTKEFTAPALWKAVNNLLD